MGACTIQPALYKEGEVMKTDDIIRLLEAGYTKEEIISMEDRPEVPEAAAPEDEKQTETPAPEDNRISETLDSLLTVVGNLQKTVDAMQKKNAAAAEMKTEKKMTADDVIKSFFAGKEQKTG